MVNDRRIPALDGIRGVPILIVIIWHYINNQLVPNESTLLNLFYCFQVISGMV